jgi:putative chitinase
MTLLKQGSKGEEVKSLQKKLGLTPDGIFGPGTEKALKEFQKSNGLTADGIAGPSTLSKMGITTASSSPSPAPSSTPVPPSSFKLEKLKGHVPDSIIAQIPDTASKFGITNVLRLSHLLSQAAHESGHWKAFTENLNYSADGLKKIFPKYFPGNLNESYARNPEKIANKVYSSRMGNGDEASGDGWKYRGRGALQLTGKSNYSEFDKIVEENILQNPDLVATKYALASAAFFFQKNNLWSICDKGSSDEVVTQVSKRVNGGTIGLAERLKLFKEYYSLLS